MKPRQLLTFFFFESFKLRVLTFFIYSLPTLTFRRKSNPDEYIKIVHENEMQQQTYIAQICLLLEDSHYMTLRWHFNKCNGPCLKGNTLMITLYV